MLDNHRLAVFVEVARRRSFSAAGHAMSYTQSAVSHHIARLELELGVRLLERGPRSCELTPAGETLFRHAERILAMISDAELDVDAAAGKSSRRVRVGSFQTAAATIVAESIAAARRSDAALELTLTEGEPLETLQRLRVGEIDLGIVFDDPARSLRALDVTFHNLMMDRVQLALPENHPAAASSHVELLTLQDEDWIEGAGAETPLTLILRDACERVGFEPRVAFNSGDFSVVLRLVAAGLGVALVPSLASYAVPPGLVIRELGGEPLHRRIRAAEASDRPRSPAAEKILHLLQAQAKRLTAAR